MDASCSASRLWWSGLKATHVDPPWEAVDEMTTRATSVTVQATGPGIALRNAMVVVVVVAVAAAAADVDIQGAAVPGLPAVGGADPGAGPGIVTPADAARPPPGPGPRVPRDRAGPAAPPGHPASLREATATEPNFTWKEIL